MRTYRSIMSKRWERFSLVLALCLLCSANAGNTVSQQQQQNEEEDYLTFCLNRGFDPFQLSCDTCQIIGLPSSSALVDTCEKCCQSYKTLDSTNLQRRYAYALLLHVPNSFHSQRMRMMGGGTPNDEVLQLLDDTEAMEEINNKKGNRLQVVRMPEESAYTVEASTLYWLEAPPPKSVLSNPEDSSRVLDQLAVSQVHVDGWKKDDLKDMLLTLLKDDDKA